MYKLFLMVFRNNNKELKEIESAKDIKKSKHVKCNNNKELKVDNNYSLIPSPFQKCVITIKN